MNVMWQGHPSYRGQNMVWHILRAAVAFVIGGAILVALSKLGVITSLMATAIMAALALVSFGYVELIRRTTTYMVTSTGVRRDSGIFNRRREEMSYRKLQTVDVTQTIIERFVLRTGTIFMGSASTDQTLDDILFEGIVDPHMVADLIRKAEDDRDQGRFAQQHAGQAAAGRFGQHGGSVVPSSGEQGGGTYSGWVDPQAPAPPQDRPASRGEAYRPGHLPPRW